MILMKKNGKRSICVDDAIITPKSYERKNEPLQNGTEERDF